MSAEPDRRTEQVPAWKQAEVDEITAFVRRYESIGVVDVSGIPSRQLQDMRAGLHGSAAIRMGRNTLIRRALSEVDEGVETLVDYVDGHVGLIGTDENPFGLYRQLEGSKTAAPINAGEVAPNDIVVPAGDTGLPPGPFVGELQNVGAAAQIVEGSIRVTEESVVAEAGDVVSDDLAAVLAELGIEPKEVGLDLRAVYADGVVFEAGELEIDVDDYRADIEAAVARGRNLSLNAGYPTRRTTRALLAAASGEARAVGLAAGIEDADLLPALVGRADAQVRALAAAIGDEEALPEPLRSVEQPATRPPETEQAEQPADDADTDTDTETPTEEAEADPDAAEPSDDGDEDEDVGGEALGDLFG